MTMNIYIDTLQHTSNGEARMKTNYTHMSTFIRGLLHWECHRTLSTGSLMPSYVALDNEKSKLGLLLPLSKYHIFTLDSTLSLMWILLVFGLKQELTA